ncbi:hypothetical protein Holit_02474 [Hollandina sp. SP2]
MKKFIALSGILVILAGTGFAEVTVSGQVDTVVMPLQVNVTDDANKEDDGDTLVGAGVGRNGSTAFPRARIGVVAGTEQVGINFKIQFFTNSTLGIDDFAEVWWKPISQLKIEAGKFVNDTLRGKIGDDNWNNYTVKMKNPDGMFTRFSSGNAGFMLGLTPMEPLFIGVSVPSLDQFTASGPDSTGNYEYTEKDEDADSTSDSEKKTVGNVLRTYEKIQAGVGYTIPNIGLVRAQYVGASHINPDSFWTDPLKVRRIEAAFAFTGMKGLVIDVGGKVPLAFTTYEMVKEGTKDVKYEAKDEDDKTITVTMPEKTGTSNTTKVTNGTKYQAPFQVSLGAGYTADALDIKGRVDAQFGGNAEYKEKKVERGMDINVHLWPSYNLGFATAGLDVGFNFIGESKTDYTDAAETDTTSKGGYQFGAGLWLKKAYGGASIKGGLALSLGEVDEVKRTVFSVPIIFDYTF